MLYNTYKLPIDKINDALKKHTTLVISAISTLVLMVSLLMPIKASAANVTMSLVSSAGTVQQNGIFTVDVNLATGSAPILDAVARVNFNPSQLSLQSQSYTQSSSWGEQGPTVGTGTGYYRVDVATTGSPFPSGNLTLARLTFQAISSSGSAAITLSEVSVGDGIDPTKTHTVAVQGVNITLAPTPAPSQPVSPGTVIPKSPSNPDEPARAGETTAPEVNQATAITDEAELAALNEANEQAAKDLEAKAAAEATAADTSNNDSQNRWLVIGGIMALLAVIGVVTYWLVHRRSGGGSNGLNGSGSNDSGGGSNSSGTNSNNYSESLSKVQGPAIPDAEAVITPKSS